MTQNDGSRDLPGDHRETQTTRESATTTSAQEFVGPYKLLQRIGEGAMGEVWLAEQQAPVHRQVAVKLIKHGMDSKQVIARFEAERQALALMDHTAIARVFDAGAAPDGRPFFVMEYVKGEPLTSYCDRYRLSVRERLDLFVQICGGVQHAHQKGILHRDLKPSNILVAVEDDRPIPKIIDFGVAKATAQRLTETTLFTELGVMIGTPEYMSPEQADLARLDVDTRTDIYALGVILYELLTGQLPFDAKELRQAGLDEIRRKIREVEPPRPSMRLSSLGAASGAPARNRRTEPGTLLRLLKGDLDWITMKALEKDRARRYASASEFAADIGCHMRDEAVQAGRPTVLYLLKKFARRHRAAFLLGALLGAAALVSISAIAYALGAKVYQENWQVATAYGRHLWLLEAAQVNEESSFAVAVFDRTRFTSGSTEVAALDVLESARAGLERDLEATPITVNDAERQALSLALLGRMYLSSGYPDRAEPLIRKALLLRERFLAESHPSIVQSLEIYADLCRRTGRWSDADDLASRARKIRARWGTAPDLAWDDPAFDCVRQILRAPVR